MSKSCRSLALIYHMNNLIKSHDIHELFGGNREFLTQVFAISHINRCRIILLAFFGFCLPFVGICLTFVGFCRYLSAFLSVFVGLCRFLSVISSTDGRIYLRKNATSPTYPINVKADLDNLSSSGR